MAAPILHVRASDGGETVFELDDRPARRVARGVRESAGAFRYDLPSSTPGLIVLQGNRPQFPMPPAVTLFTTTPGRLLTLSVDRGGGRYGPDSALFLYFYDDAGLVDRARVALGAGNAAASIRVPDRPTRVAAALRLVGENEVATLTLSWASVEPPPIAPLPSPPLASVVPIAAAAMPPAPAHAPWDAILVQARAGSGRVVTGVATPATTPAIGFRAIRVDEDLGDVRLGGGYLFDTRVADRTFGWEGVFGAENIPANLALARHLAAVRAAGLSAVLLHDDGAARRPFFRDFAALFTVHLGVGDAPEQPDLAVLFPALAEPLKRTLDDPDPR